MRWWVEEQREREAEEQCMQGTQWDDDSMEVDDIEGLSDEELSDDEDADTEEIRKLKVSCLGTCCSMSADRGHFLSSRSAGDISPSGRKNSIARRTSTLLVDTNILLSSLSEFSSLVESGRWTVVVPLPVIMELDSQSSNMS